MLSHAVWTWHLVGQSFLFPSTSLSIGKHKRWERVRYEVWMWRDLCRYCCIIRAVILKAVVSCTQFLPLICSLSISLHPVHLNGCFWITPWQKNARFLYSSRPMDTWVMLYCLFMSIPLSAAPFKRDFSVSRPSDCPEPHSNTNRRDQIYWCRLWMIRRNGAEFSFRVSLDGQILSVSAEHHVTNDIEAAAVNEVYSRTQRLLVKNSVNLSHSAFPFPLLLQSHQGDTLMPGARR